MILMLWHGVKIIIAEADLCEPHQRGTTRRLGTISHIKSGTSS